MNLNYARTAIARGNSLSAPVKWIGHNFNLAGLDIINFGEGQAFSDTAYLNYLSGCCVGYDPHSAIRHRRIYPQPADLVVAVYVLNVLPRFERYAVLNEIVRLAPRRLVAVRADSSSVARTVGTWHEDGRLTSNNTFQTWYDVPKAMKDFPNFDIVHKTSGYLLLKSVDSGYSLV